MNRSTTAGNEDEPLWSGRICPDHPGFRGRTIPEDRSCKNCWRVLMGYPTRMRTDRFRELHAA